MKKQFSIVGQKFRGLDPYLPGINAGTEVVLVREPDNKYDKNAVMVVIGGKHVGYLSSKQNAPVAVAIDRTGFDFDLPVIAADSAVTSVRRKAVKATFIRSPNSAYPMVEVTE